MSKRKTIGIVTTFRQPNWGSVLQAFATVKMLEELGYDGVLIDYIYPNEYHFAYGMKPFYNPNPSLRKRLFYALGLRKPSIQGAVDRFIARELKTTTQYPSRESILANPPIFDIYLSGSDQIWNPDTMFCDATYFCDFAPQGARKISYASSVSKCSISAAALDSYRQLLESFSAVSVREKAGAAIIDSIVKCPVVLDPTIMLSPRHWTHFAEKSKLKTSSQKYILAYILRYSFSAEQVVCKALEDIQKRLDLPILFLNPAPKMFKGRRYKPFSSRTELTPYDFVKLISNASALITTSYHGTAFAANLGVPFISIVKNPEEDDRISTLLDNVGLSDHIMRCDSPDSATDIPLDFDVTACHERLNYLRASSLEYLTTALEYKKPTKSVFLSIIIPVYNVSSYIRHCIESVIAGGNLDDVEVILVNDGTPDNSIELVQDLIDLHGFTLINQENKGLSGARNTGLASCSGRYVWFVDSDDSISPGAIDILRKAVSDYPLTDIFVTDIIKEVEGGKVVINAKGEINAKGKINAKGGETALMSPEQYIDNKGVMTPVQKFIIRREVLEGLSFAPGLLHEDNEIIPYIMNAGSYLVRLPEPLYHYLVRSEGSITSSYKMRNFESVLEICRKHLDFVRTLESDSRIDTYKRLLFKDLKSLAYVSSKVFPDKPTQGLFRAGNLVNEIVNYCLPALCLRDKLRAQTMISWPWLYFKLTRF